MKQFLRETWMLLALAVLGVAGLAIMHGCKSGFRIPSFGGSGKTPQTSGAQHTFQAFDYMALMAFVPGLLITVASVWVKPLRDIGIMFLIIGIGTAAMSFLLEQFVLPIVYTGLGVGVLYASWWAWDFQFNYRKPRRIMAEKLDDEGIGPDQRVAIAMQIEQLDVLYGRDRRNG